MFPSHLEPISLEYQGRVCFCTCEMISLIIYRRIQSVCGECQWDVEFFHFIRHNQSRHESFWSKFSGIFTRASNYLNSQPKDSVQNAGTHEFKIWSYLHVVLKLRSTRNPVFQEQVDRQQFHLRRTVFSHILFHIRDRLNNSWVRIHKTTPSISC